jgi:D-alanyl-lipoteichoic acid acyltransferase DltB (MBOAT superfamily)
MDIEAVNIFARTYNQVAGSNDFDVSLLILPVGISFYTFQALSYAIDVYRKKIAPVRNILDFGFYVSFFPQLVAGPIIRASEFIPQIYRKYCLTRQNFWRAVLLIMGGLTKKIIVSDYIAFNYVDRIFDAPTLYSGFELLMGAYAYAIQIYCDFSGYTDIAVGLAMILGFHLPINFNSPYKAHSMSDFWHRWHISLSTWLRDYLYIPLGGNRKGNRRTYLNLLITMLLGGLWHGASFKFVVWGGLHGAALIVERCLHKIIAPHILRSGVLRVVGIVITFHAVCLLWIVFRASDITAAADFITRIFVWFNSDSVVDIVMAYLPVFVIMAAAYCIHFLPTRLKEWVRRRFVAMPIAFKIIAIVIFVFLMYQMSAAETQPFIYFQF